MMPYRQIIPAAWGICFVIFGMLKALRLKQILDERPRSADPSMGYTEPIRVKRETLYVTDGEKAWFDRSKYLLKGLLLSGFVAFLIALVIIPVVLHHISH